MKLDYDSVRPPAHNPYYVTTSHNVANQISQAGRYSAVTGTPFIEIMNHQAQSALAVPVMPVSSGRSLHFHTHAATHTLPHQQSLTYPNWVPFTHFG